MKVSNEVYYTGFNLVTFVCTVFAVYRKHLRQEPQGRDGQSDVSGEGCCHDSPTSGTQHPCHVTVCHRAACCKLGTWPSFAFTCTLSCITPSTPRFTHLHPYTFKYPSELEYVICICVACSWSNQYRPQSGIYQ